ncbi:MAG: hypothetical protein ACJ790_01385 [Myxococcaceae bacterium]
MFGFGGKKKNKAGPGDDPLKAYDAYLEDLDRQAGEVRKSAATLLAMRSTLRRDQDKYQKQLIELGDRYKQANDKHDAKALRLLQADLDHTQKMIDSTAEALTRAENDAQLLMDAAKELSEKADSLRAERASARARLAAGLAVTTAMRQEVTRLDKVLALDKARDEVERAFALAQIYREDKGGDPGG